jgi:hypothetical protein
MTTEEQYRRILQNHLPAQAVDYVYNYLNQHKVHFHITRERRTKYGDYRWPQPKHDFHEISVNGDLNPYLFLWVFLHEAAHLEVHLKYDSHLSPFTSHLSPSPHGHEWQEEYRLLLIAHAACFPPDLQPLLKRYTRRIPLSHSVKRDIEAALRRHDPGYNPADAPLTLNQLQPGDRFRLLRKPDLHFEALERRRTRWLCREVVSGRQYLVNGTAEITKNFGEKC